MPSLEMLNNTLTQIYKRFDKRIQARNKTGKIIPWYKISSGGKCPDTDEYENIDNIYWKHFGCLPYDFIGNKEEKGKNAFQCASERLAEIKQRLHINENVNSEHIYPIKLAYDMGKTCLQNTLLGDRYTTKFRNYYNEITNAYPQTIPLFQTDVEISKYPLEMNKKRIKNFINSKLKQNPFITTNKNKNKNKNKNNKTRKQTPQKSNSNKTLKQNVLSHVK